MPDRWSGTVEPRDPRWQVRDQGLAFRLGDVTLFRRTHRCAVLTTPFFERSGDPDSSLPPFADLEADVEAVVARSHPVHGPLPRVTVTPTHIRYVVQRYERCCVALDGSFERYLARFPGKSRAQLLKKVRRFAELSGGKADWREYRSPAEMDEFHRLAREVSLRTYQERLLGAGLPDTPDFIEEMRKLAQRDAVRGYLLFLSGQPVAYLYLPIEQGVVTYDYVGYDPSARHLSPGTVLQYHVLERLFSETGFRMFDFTEGEDQHKRLFSTHRVPCADIFYYRPGIRNRLLVAFHAALADASSGVGRVLARWGLKDSVKRWLRGA